MSGQGQGSQNSLEGLEGTLALKQEDTDPGSPRCQREFRTMTNGAEKWVMWEGL